MSLATVIRTAVETEPEGGLQVMVDFYLDDHEWVVRYVAEASEFTTVKWPADAEDKRLFMARAES